MAIRVSRFPQDIGSKISSMKKPCFRFPADDRSRCLAWPCVAYRRGRRLEAEGIEFIVRNRRTNIRSLDCEGGFEKRSISLGESRSMGYRAIDKNLRMRVNFV